MAKAKQELTNRTVRGPRDQLLTVDQVAERLNVSVTYVRRRLIFERRIPYIKVGRHVRVEQAVVEAFIDEGRVTPGSYAGHADGFVPRIKPKRRP